VSAASVTQPEFVVITGGPGSGKTTVIEALAGLGYRTVPEAAIQVIEELNQELGLEGQKRWRAAHTGRFQDRVLDLQIELEKKCATAPGFVFLDRGRLDGLAYLRHFGGGASSEQLDRIGEVRYSHVFLLATLRSFSERGASGRTSQRADSLAIAKRIEEVYRESGYQPVALPQMPPADRVAFIVAKIGVDSGG
jgi:predicted ATPase